MLIIFKNRLFKTDVYCSDIYATYLEMDKLVGDWIDNPTQYFCGRGSFNPTVSHPGYAQTINIPIQVDKAPCINFHADIYTKGLYLDNSFINSEVSGMNVLCTVTAPGGGIIASVTLTGTTIRRKQDNEYFCDLDPCLMTDIFIGPGYIRYSSFSYNTTTSNIQHDQTISYIQYEYPNQGSSESTINIYLTNPYITSSLDAGLIYWSGPWYYSGYVKTFYGSM